MNNYSLKRIQYMVSGTRKSIDFYKTYRHHHFRATLRGIGNRFKFYGGF